MSAPMEHGPEPIRGLPGALPPGERILWQGAPDWRVLARTALHVGWVAAWFAAIALWRVGVGVVEGRSLLGMAGDVGVTALVGAGAVGLLAAYAWAVSRTTVYTLTNRRFVLRHGVALSKCFNIPYQHVESAGLKVDAAGVGDIPLRLTPESKVAYPHLWPHARPVRIVNPEPMLRAVPQAAVVAETLTRAWAAEVGDLARTAAVEPVAKPVRAKPRRPAAGQPAAA